MMSPIATFGTCALAQTTSVYRGRREVTEGQTDAIDASRTLHHRDSCEPLRPLLDLTSGGSMEGLGHGHCTIYTLQERQT